MTVIRYGAAMEVVRYCSGDVRLVVRRALVFATLKLQRLLPQSRSDRLPGGFAGFNHYLTPRARVAHAIPCGWTECALDSAGSTATQTRQRNSVSLDDRFQVGVNASSGTVRSRRWRVWLVASLWAAILVPTVTHTAHAQMRSRCTDKGNAGDLECSYGPQEVWPWRHGIPGPIKATRYSFNESDAKAEYLAILAEGCPNCCNPGSLVNEGTWQDNVGGWGAGYPSSSSKPLTYERVARNGDGTCATPTTISTSIYRFRDLACDTGWSGSWNEPTPYFCFRKLPPRQWCPVSKHPVAYPVGNKVFSVEDYRSVGAGGLSFVRDYRSGGYSDSGVGTPDRWTGLSHSWTHNFAGSLVVASDAIWLRLGPSEPYHFALPDPQAAYPRLLAPKRRGEHVRLTQVDSERYILYTAQNEIVVFDSGKPTAKSTHTGWRIDLTQGSFGPVTATDPAGRTLSLQYDGAGHLVTLVDPAGQNVAYEYKGSLANPDGQPYLGTEFTTLRKVTFQDGATWHYVVPDWTAFGGTEKYLATRITGTIDELGVPFQNIQYTVPGGMVSSTSLAGGVEAYTFSGTTVTDPLGSTRNYNFSTSGPHGNLSSEHQPAGAGCPASSKSYTYDAATWNPTSETDFRGNKACLAYDVAGRNVELVRVEGLASSATCSAVTGAGAALPNGSRKTSKQWHPDWRLQTKVAEPGRVTTYVYNGQQDPFNGNAVASCAPAAALLPDGKPIAVLCRQVEQATTDTNGSVGFSATLQVGVAHREQQWTYNQHGQVLTHDGPRSDVGDVTTYTYYGDTSFSGAGSAALGHALGDLQSVTNANGQVTQFTQYDKHGQLIESIDPNGVVTTNAYDLRQRLLSSTVAGQTTSYTYDAAGQLKRITRPDGSYVGFDYDAAHRQTAAFDNLGNRIEYTLDNAGNRTAESVKDTTGALRRQLARSIDALGRIQQMTGRE